MRHDNMEGVREFIWKMVHIQTKLKAHDIDLDEKFLVPHVLNCLFVEFTQIKGLYNIFGEKWIITNLITKYVAKEEKLKKEKSNLALLTFHDQD